MRPRSLLVRYAAGLAFAYLLTAAEVVAIVISVSRETVIEAQSVLSAAESDRDGGDCHRRNRHRMAQRRRIGRSRTSPGGQPRNSPTAPAEGAEHHQATVRDPADAMGYRSCRDDSVEHRRRHPGPDTDRFGDHVRRDSDGMYGLSIHATPASRVDGRRHSGFRTCREGAGSTGTADTDVDDVFCAPRRGHRSARHVASERLDHPGRRADRDPGVGARTRRGGAGPARDDPGVLVDFGPGTRRRRRDGGGRARTPRTSDRCV